MLRAAATYDEYRAPPSLERARDLLDGPREGLGFVVAEHTANVRDELSDASSISNQGIARGRSRLEDNGTSILWVRMPQNQTACFEAIDDRGHCAPRKLQIGNEALDARGP